MPRPPRRNKTSAKPPGRPPVAPTTPPPTSPSNAAANQPLKDPVQRKILADIAEFGFGLVCVMDDDQGPGFVYSVGFQDQLDHPEVVVFSYRGVEETFELVAQIGRKIKQGARFDRDGQAVSVPPLPHRLKVIEVDPAWHAELFGYGLWYRARVASGIDLQIVQCLHPDKAGRFPDDPECEPGLAALQPLLNEVEFDDDEPESAD